VARERRSSRKPREWPSVEEQLRDARAVHGSALERLIRENQNLELLHPDELGDGLPIPPWLRVNWRKQHSDQVPDSSSPAASYPYPDVLDSLYEWMRIHQDLPGWDWEARPSGGGQPRRRSGGTR
jgi:hypothetical protein